MWQTKYASAVLKNLGLGVKAISSMGVRSPWFEHILVQSKSTTSYGYSNS